ncbi:MAG: pyruvate kinase [Planctomycetes bacterium]|nr:pyruvate kinase [Planctomycetota bacterium]
MSKRRTRIVATLGPATDTPAMLRAILEAGVDVVRINFSHGTAEEHLARIARLREASRELKMPVAVLGDLPGPKLRVRMTGERLLTIGQELVFSRGEKALTEGDLVITEPEILDDLAVGHRILLDDGRLQLETARITPERVFARVTVGGKLLPNKGVNLPDTPLTFPAMTDRDRQAIAVAAQGKVDWLALSFVRKASAADDMRAEMRKHFFDAPILAKLERPEAVEHAKAIIAAFDGIMVARGDLGVEIPLECVPTAQKKMIALALQAGKPVITATDMLDSMRQNPRPTRAEAGDVANAIYDGTDAVMLSGETAVGLYPVESVACMNRIAIEAESHLREVDRPIAGPVEHVRSIDDHITQTVVELAAKIGADAIITPTTTGRTARLIARHRPPIAIIAPVPSETILRRMMLVWGVQPVLREESKQAGEDRVSAALKASFDAGAVVEGQRVILLSGNPVHGGAHLPTIRFVRVGARGTPEEP